MRRTHQGRAGTPGTGRFRLLPGVCALASLVAAPVSSAAGQTALGWQEIEALLTGAAGGTFAPDPPASAGPMSWGEISQFLGQSGPGEAAAAGPSLAEQLNLISDGLARFDGITDATGALPFADLRSGSAYLIARHPLLSGGYDSGTGAVGKPILLGEASHLSLELGHVERASLSLAASANQLGAQIENRSLTQMVASLGEQPTSQFSLILARSELDRKQSAGYAYEDLYSTSSFGSYGQSAPAGETDTTGVALDWSFFSGRAVLKAGFARSLFSAPESPLTLLGFDDPLAELATPEEEGDARYLDLSLTPVRTEEGLLELKFKQSDTEEEFEGGGWAYGSGVAERSLSAEGRWKGLSLGAENREREDRLYASITDQRSARASLLLDELDLSLSRRLHESTSEYTYLSYLYDQDPDDYYAGRWVPVKVRNTRSSDSWDGAASLHGDAWSVDLDWSRSQGLYKYGSGGQSAQDSQDLNASASYDFGLIGLQGLLSRSDQLYGVEPDPVVSTRTETGLTLSFDFDGSGHRYAGAYAGPYGPTYGSYGASFGADGAGYFPAGEFPWLAPGLIASSHSPVPGYAVPQPGSVGVAPATVQTDPSSLVSRLLPSTARVGLRRGIAREDSGDDGLDGLPSIFSNELSAPQGPYYAIEGGLGWVGASGSSTDLSLRVTVASGDEDRYAAGGISYEAELSQRFRRGPLGLGASIEGTLSRFDQPSEVDTEIYATASVYASYSIDRLSFDAQAYGTHQQTRYADGSDPYASDYANLQLGAQATLDRMLPAAWLRAEAPPYLRLRGYYEFGYSASAYDTLASGSAGVILFGGFLF
jgi:hypothetical protein